MTSRTPAAPDPVADLDPRQIAELAALVRRTLDTVPPNPDRPADRRMRARFAAFAEQIDPE